MRESTTKTLHKVLHVKYKIVLRNVLEDMVMFSSNFGCIQYIYAYTTHW